jgi:predicted DNA-binding transcriptional regulator YafY
MRQALRTFRLDRISLLEQCESGFERPVDFDVKAYLQQSMPFVQSRFNVEVWLDLPVAKARLHFALHRVAIEEENGGTRIRCGREQLDAFGAMLLSVGCRLVVRAPDELRQVFATLARRAAEAAEDL